ncbi:MAG: hypothetical protein ABWZ79_13710 [Pedobacter agri]
MEKQVFKVSEIEISYRPAFKLLEKPKVTSSNIAYGILEQNKVASCNNYLIEHWLTLQDFHYSY